MTRYYSLKMRLTVCEVTFTEEEKKSFEDREKAREFRAALEQDMNVSFALETHVAGADLCVVRTHAHAEGLPLPANGAGGSDGLFEGQSCQQARSRRQEYAFR